MKETKNTLDTHVDRIDSFMSALMASPLLVITINSPVANSGMMMVNPHSLNAESPSRQLIDSYGHPWRDEMIHDDN